MSKCLGNLTAERQMQVLHSRYVQAIMQEENLNASQAIEALNRQLDHTGRGDTPLPSSGPVLSSKKRVQSNNTGNI
jgi:hypothetical protein